MTTDRTTAPHDDVDDASTGDPQHAGSIWRGPLGRSSVGLFALAFLVAFEAFAVITVMPVVARDLDGLGAYALAFSVPVAVSVLARTVAAPWADRAGPAPALAWGVALFSAGLLVAGVAGSMTWFLVGRGVQGLGTGAVGVALHVWVARAYPARLRPRALAVMTSAWTLPALVGPPLAGGMAHLVGWRAVFLLAPVLAGASLLLAWSSVRALGPGHARDGARRRVPLLSASCATLGVLAVAAGSQRVGPAWPALLVAGLAVVALSVRPLVPPRTWTGGRGLPSLMGARSLVASAFFAAEVYVPLTLVDARGIAVGAAGAALSGAALAWFAGAWLVSRPEVLRGRLGTPAVRARWAAVGVATGILALPLALVPAVPVPVVVVVWSVGGLGMGAAMTTLVGEVLERSPGREGEASGALQTSDSVAESTAVALGAAVFGAVVAEGVGAAALAAFVVPALCAVGGLTMLPRAFASSANGVGRP